LVMKEWSYASTPPMGRTACAEPQCLYKGALYLDDCQYVRLHKAELHHRQLVTNWKECGKKWSLINVRY